MYVYGERERERESQRQTVLTIHEQIKYTDEDIRPHGMLHAKRLGEHQASQQGKIMEGKSSWVDHPWRWEHVPRKRLNSRNSTFYTCPNRWPMH